MLKWNATGNNVYITDKAIYEFLNCSKLEKQSKAIEHNHRAPKGSRCFVAEHMFPTKQLQIFCFEVFEDYDPSFEEFKKIFQTLNVLCYVWYEEDVVLRKSGLNSDITQEEKEVDFVNLFNRSLDGRTLEKNLINLQRLRYDSADIPLKAMQTKFKSGVVLFKQLSSMRQDHYELNDVIERIAY